jgi:uncharacterized protein YbaP (TraB family)
MMGSVHALMEEDYPLPVEFEQAFSESETLVVEVNLNNVTSSQVVDLLKTYGTYEEGDLSQHLGQDTMAILEEYLAITHQEIDSYLHMKPWLVSLQISSQILKTAGYEPELGIDRHFLTKAEGNKQIIELESLETQIKLLASETPEAQEKALRLSLLEKDTFQEDLTELIAAWQRGDADGMYQQALESLNEDDGQELRLAELVDNRNIEMVRKIKGYLAQKGTYMVVVGALHMGGDSGILKLLGEDHAVEQIQRKLPGLD